MPEFKAFVEEYWPQLGLPDSQDYSPSAHESVFYGAHEAILHKHDYVGSEHLFLGVLRASGGSFHGIGQSLDIDDLARRVMRMSSNLVSPSEEHFARAAVERQADAGSILRCLSERIEHGQLVMTPRSVANLRRATTLASDQHGRPTRADAEHLALAIAEDQDGVVARAVRDGQPEQVQQFSRWVAGRIAWGPLLNLVESAEHPTER